MEILDKYNEELEEDIKIDVVNIVDVQRCLPGIKHKWVSRLIQHKMERDRKVDLYKKAKDTLMEKLSKDSKVVLSRNSLDNKANAHETLQKIRNKIRDEEYIIEFLEKIEKILNSTTYDIKNMVELMKMEQM